jgi:hypothetical protein
LPAAQSVQTEAPAPEYVPATQLVQSAALVFASETENLPATQLVHTEAPAAEYVLALHFSHTVRPGLDVYVPAGHATHEAPKR